MPCAKCHALLEEVCHASELYFYATSNLAHSAGKVTLERFAVMRSDCHRLRSDCRGAAAALQTHQALHIATGPIET